MRQTEACKLLIVGVVLWASSCAVNVERRRICIDRSIGPVELCVWRQKDIRKIVAGCIWEF